MLIESLDLKHKDLLKERFRNLRPSLSEYSFANLYLFRKTHKHQILMNEDIYIAGITYDGLRYIMPTHNFEHGVDRIHGVLKNYDCLFPIPEEWLGFFDASLYNINYRDEDTDYIHKIDKMSTYQGKKLHSKKNLLYQFLDSYDHETHPLTEDRLPDAVQILDAWQADSEERAENTDYYPCREAISLYEELGLCGGIYYVGPVPAGFIIGEEINDTMFALHFAKGLIKFKGIYQFMFNNFAQVMPSKYCCFNFEQDLGKESLRQAKSSYKPDDLLKKYRISLKK